MQGLNRSLNVGILIRIYLASFAMHDMPLFDTHFLFESEKKMFINLPNITSVVNIGKIIKNQVYQKWDLL